jgi:hypothetical protein
MAKTTAEWEKAIWPIVNRRRGELINLKYSTPLMELSKDDQKELDLLQEYADYYLERFDAPRLKFLQELEVKLG